MNRTAPRGEEVAGRPDPLLELVRVRAALAAGLAPAEALGAVPGGPLAAVASAARLGRTLGDLADAAAVVLPGGGTRRRRLPGARPTSGAGGEPLQLEPHQHLLVRALAVAERAGLGGTAGVDQALSAVRDTRAATRLLLARTTQARGTATLLAALPLAAWTLLVGLDPAALAFYRTPPGVLTGVLACAGMLAGRWWSRRLLDAATRAAAMIDPLQPPPPPRDLRRGLVAAAPAGAVLAAAVGPAPALVVGVMVGTVMSRRSGGNVVDLSAGGTAEVAELLALALSSGLAPPAAVGLLADAGPPAARRHLTAAHRRLQAGWPPAAAFDGTRLTAIGDLLDAVARWGAPAAASLQALAADLRDRRRVATEEAAERAQLALVFPTTLLILPAFILAVVPPLVWAGLVF